MVNVAILGFGVVGSGVAEVLATNGPHIDRKAICSRPAWGAASPSSGP